MITKRLVFILALLVSTTLVSQARAAMTIYGYEPENHARFYSSPDRDFIGEGYDWSGVGLSAGVYPGGGTCPGGTDWATMISPQYFLTAAHAPPEYGEHITFYENDDLTKSNPHEYVVDIWSQNWGDLCLRRLTEPLHPEDNIAYYPILDLQDSDYSKYFNLTFFAYGHTYRVGRNQADEDGIKNRTINSSPTISMQYDYKAPPVYPEIVGGLGDDECRIEPGDSGGPSFVALGDDKLALIGIHWYTDFDSYSGDSFVPRYIGSISSYVSDMETFTPIGGDANMDGIVNDIDASILSANWNQSHAAWTQGDFNDNGYVDAADAAIMAANWLRTAMPTTPTSGVSSLAVPEPATALLLLTGLAFATALHFFRRSGCSSTPAG